PVIKDQRTYGRSRYPFSATSYQPPTLDQFPGFIQFQKNLLYLDWNHTVTPRHVDLIAGAVEKVLSALRTSAVPSVSEGVCSKAPTFVAREIESRANTRK